ncbi:protein sickie isoform X4 [Bicyclus anynana]|uniref:Protein sickie isoform X4 n=1 Tax=Bicyclus anynana TaxID=110368 RepID=A0ABM3LDX4_BICAN|nr:protein sickie isoform X4 [Bicyclus anynana]
MTSPRRSKKSGQCVLQHLDWDSPSAATGTVKRRSSCPENSSKKSQKKDEGIFEVQTPSDSGSGTSRSLDENDKSDSLIEVEERISCIINENRSSQSNSEASDVDIVIDSILENPIRDDLLGHNDLFGTDRSKTFIKSTNPLLDRKNVNSDDVSKKVKEKRLSTPVQIKKINKSFDFVKSTKSTKIDRSHDKSSVLPVYKSTIQECSVDLSGNSQKKKNSKLKLPFSPAKAMDKPKTFFQSKTSLQETKPSPLLSSPIRRTISNEYVRLKFTNDTVVRRTIDGKSVQKITPKIQSIIPESPIDNEDPFLNLSPNKKYTVTVNNKVRCDKDNYVIFDPKTGFKPEELSKQSRIPSKCAEKSKIPLKSPVGEKSLVTRKSVSVSDTDSGILSPNSPGETSENVSSYYVNAAVFSETAKKCASDLDIKIVDPAIARKATEQIKIYTDWANHYLERARSRRRAGTSGGGLARDCADGLLLADVLEGVTGQKVTRAHRKPRNPQQMLENVQCCLDFLHAQKVQGLEQVTAVDIRDAKLKAVLALFFALSRHKQASKQRTVPSSGNVSNAGKSSNEDASLSSVQRITGGSSDEILTACGNNVEMTTLTANRQVSVLQTSIPLPASAAAVRRAPPDKRPLPATPVHGGKSGLSASSSRSTSPLGQGAISFIPRAPNSSSGSRPNSSLLAPGSKIPSTLTQTQQNTQNTNSQNGTPTKQSMLDKLKLFNKDKISSEKQSSKSTVVSKRTSSSSGFSSAKSERSDSSLSLNESANATNTHIKSSNLIGPKSIRQQNDPSSKDKTSKNVKTKLVNSKVVKESSTNASKSNAKSNSNEKSRNSPKLPARDTKLSTPKSVSNTKLNQIDDHCRNSKSKIESKMVKVSGNQMKFSDQRLENSMDYKTYENTKNQSNQLQSPSPSNGPSLPLQNHTGIPKPTAAVKGTSKISKEERHNILHKSTNSQLSPIQSNSSLNSTNNVLPFSREQSNLNKEVSQKQTLAVSPMPVSNSGNQNPTSQMSESSHSNSTHSTTGQQSNSSDGSVIYRPSSESGSEISKSSNLATNRRLDMNTTYINDVINEAEISEKEAAQKRMLDKPSPRPIFELNKTLTEYDKSDSSSSTPTHCRENSLGDDENPLMNVLPMRPLLRGYNSHLTLPMRTSGLAQKNIPGYPHHANTVKANFGRENMGLRDRINYGPGFSNPDYCDLEVASGYMSDGDCLRRINVNEMDCGRNNDIMDGYMSEGGASLYGRRINYQQPSQFQLDDRRGGVRRGMEGGSGVVYRVVGRTRNKADCGQQTERQPPTPRDTTWKKYTDSPGVGGPPLNQQAQTPPSPSHGRKGDRRTGHHSPQHHKREKLTAAQQLGIAPHPQYPAPNSSSQHSSRGGGSQLQSPSGPSSRPSSVSSGGNGSTCSSGKAKVPQNFGYVKRQNGSQPPPPPPPNGPPQHGHPGRTAQVSAVPRTKVKVSGGTQTCTQDLQIHKNGIGPKSYSLGGTAAAQLSASVRERLLGSQSLPKPGTHEFAALFHHHRAVPRGGMKISDGSLSDTQTYSEVKSDYGIPYAPWLRHRSTKSEKLYPSMLQRSSESDYEPYYCLPVQYGPGGQGLNYGVSEPPSPSPRSALSPTHQPGNVMHTPRHSHHYPKKNDEAHGSTASLVSTASSLAAGAGNEERHAHEVRKLRRELGDAKEKVHTLTTQLTTNAHVVSAFEQSLSNMTQRLQQLTATAERKDSELTDLRQTIELLRKQSIQAGLTTAHMQSMGIRADGVNVTGQEPNPPQTQQFSPQRLAQGNGAITRHLSTDSVSSINSLSSGSSVPHDKKHKKKGWLRSSFTKAFSRNAKISKTAKHSSLGQLSSQDSSSGSHHYDDPHTIREGSNENSLEHSHETLDNSKDKTTCPAANAEEQTKEKQDQAVLVDELKRQLREKDLVLTDIRLEALSSAHQLESLKDTVIKMRNEMLNLKHNNERLQRLVTSRSLAGSQSSLGTGGSAVEDPRRFSLADQSTMHQAVLDIHSQPLDLDFNCMSSTPSRDLSKKGSPKTSIVEPIYGNKAVCELNENSEALLGALNGASDIFTNGLSAGDRISGDYDINTVLPPPKSRELAIGESYSDIGVADSQGDTTDGKKIAIAVYLGQPETFQRYFEEVQDTLTESECRFYAKQTASSFNNHFDKQPSFDSPRISQTHSPEIETQDYPQSINKSNTNSLKSNKSTHSNSYKNVYNSDSTINCNEFTIAYTYISGKTTWQNLDYIVRKTFKDYLSRIDPGTNLGLNTDSITSYHLGEATRGPEIGFPELLPCGYIVGTVNTLYICLQGVGSLAFDSLIPKNIVYRYVSLLSEHRRVILCGPSGTGKSYLAAKLAEFYVQRTQRRGNPVEAVATFNVDRKSCNELRAYLANIAEQCSGAAAGEEALPAVVVLDNLQHASALGDAFAGLLPPDTRNMPVIIGTMSQATCNTTNLQLHHNFRWLLTANHMEPVKGFLARYLRRKLFSLELRLGRREPALAAVLEWLPGVWSTLNAFLEAHSSSDVTVGPRLFLACPMDLEASQAWFADVWNYSIVPYASEAVREGVALYGRRRHAAVDPLQHVKSSYPWREPNHSHTLRPISVEDAGMEEANQDANTNSNQDPLLNMLMRLQEAANYSGNQSQDSDNASMDSNLTHDSSMGNEL